MALGRLDAQTTYLVLTGASTFFLATITTITAVYRVTAAGLDPFQLVLVGTVLEATVLLCELPTGVVADVFGRRLSVTLGLLLLGAGFLVEGALPIFAPILLAQVIAGVGYTFISGAQEAWIADEIGEARLSEVYLRGAQVGQAGALAGALVSVALASIQLNLPILVGGALLAGLALFLSRFMPETGFRPRPRGERATWRALAGTLTGGGRLVRAQPVLLTILAAAAFAGMSSEGFDRLWAAHFLDAFTFPALGSLDPVVWFGIINVVTMLLSIGATELVRRRLALAGEAALGRLLFGINALLIVSVALFGLAGNVGLALAAFWSASVLRRVHTPVYQTWLNQRLDPRVRATVLSMAGQLDALGQVAGGPVIGLVGSVASLRAAMVAAAVTLSPALLLYARALRQATATRPPVAEAVAEAEP